MAKIQIRRGTTAEWAAVNPVLSSGELGLDITLGGLKFGNGVLDWASLPFGDAATVLVNSATATSEAIQSTNMVADPHGKNAASFGLNNGSGNVAALTTTIVSGKRRIVWGANALSASGPNAMPILIPGNFQVGETYTISMLAKSSRDNNLQLGWYIKNAANASVGGGGSGNNTMLSGVERRLSYTGNVTATGTSLYFYLYYNASNGGTYPLAGDWLEIDEIMAKKSNTSDTFYDGNTAPVGNTSYRWAGVPNASSSYQVLNSTNMIRRGPAGTFESASPVNVADVATKGYVDTALGRARSNVIAEGAKADADDVGGTDDTFAFQKAMDKAWGTFGLGGTMLIPGNRQYHIQGAVTLRSNVRIIGWGAVIRKYGLTGGYSSFVALSGTAKGYGSSITNVLFEGLSFRGRFSGIGTGNGNAITMHHAQGVTFRKCNWSETNISGHALDLMGCNGIIVDDCTFKGYNPGTGSNKEYTEAIQLDYSMSGGGGTDDAASYDGLPSINVTVQNSKFLPQTIGGVTYPAPNPIGSHNRVQTQWIENIRFINNYVEGCVQHTSTDTFAVLLKGWIHFLSARNIFIMGNTFKNVPGRTSKVFQAYAITSGTTLSGVSTGAAATSMTPMAMQNLFFEHNTLIGFDSDTNEALVECLGTTTQQCRNIQINRNTVRDSFSTPGVTGDKGSDFIYLNDTTGATVEGNHLTDARTLIYGYKVRRLVIRGGSLVNMGAHLGRFSTCEHITIDTVDVDGHGGGWYFYNNCSGIDISGGAITGGRADSLLPKHITFSAATDWSVHDIRIPFDAANSYTCAINAYSTSPKGRVKECVGIGWANDAAFVSIGTGSTPIFSGNTY